MKFHKTPQLMRCASALPFLALALASMPAVAQDAQGTPAAAEPTGGLQDIVVTARRQAENLQSTPVAVTAMTMGDMQARAATDLRDIARFTPNVYFSTVGAQSPDNSAVTIRGIGVADAFATIDPGVGIYVDGVYYARSQGGVMDLVDLERVEVLRGPQGTLFGKNTSGGAVNLISAPPSKDGGGSASVTVGNIKRLEVQGVASFSLSDDLAVKITGVSRSRGCLWNRDGDQACYGSIDRTTGRIYVRYQKDGLTADLIGDLTRGRSTVRPHKLIDYDPNTGIFATHNSLVGTPGFRGTLYTATSPGANNPTYFTSGDQPTDAPLNAGGVSLQLHYEVGDATLHSITAWRHVDARSQEDTWGKRNGWSGVASYTKSNWWSQEFRVDGKALDGKLNYIAGLYYFHENGTTNEGVDSGHELNRGRINYNDQVTNSYAAFANISYELVDNLRLSGGIRYTHEEKNWHAKFVNFSRIAALQPGGHVVDVLFWDPTTFPNTLNADFNPAFVDKTVSFNPISPKIGLDYQVTPDLLLFTSVSKGFRSGGFNGRAGTPQAAAPFRPESTTSFEAGFKSEMFDRHLRLNATGYYTKYKDLQQSVLIGSIVNGNQVFAPVVTNAANARIWGFEGELTALIGDNFRLEGNVGYTNSRFTDVDAAATAATGLTKDSVFPNVPEFTAAVGASYDMHLGGWTLTPRVDYTYRSEVYFRIDSKSYASSAPPSTRSTTPGIGMVNATLTLTGDDNDWSVQLYGRNLTNKVYYLFMNDLLKVTGSAGTLVEPSDPREFGVIVSRKF